MKRNLPKVGMSTVKIWTLFSVLIAMNILIKPVVASEVISEECSVPKIPEISESRTGYQIWPGDSLQVSVWQNPELSMSVVVRPDGRVSIPLVEELDVAGKAPAVVAKIIEERLGSFIKSPLVTVIVTGFSDNANQSVRVIGAAVKPQDIRYSKGMNLLDLAVQLGGLSQYAAGNRAKLVREVCGESVTYPLRIEDLINGEIENNVDLQQGDVVIIPESMF